MTSSSCPSQFLLLRRSKNFLSPEAVGVNSAWAWAPCSDATLPLIFKRSGWFLGPQVMYLFSLALSEKATWFFFCKLRPLGAIGPASQLQDWFSSGPFRPNYS